MAETNPAATTEPLIYALNSLSNSVCTRAAEKLAASTANSTTYNLHLRNATLNFTETTRIADAIIATTQAGSALQSFSMSYNPGVGDEGVAYLAKSLPLTVTEVGLVQCGFGDAGANAILQWAHTAQKLHWLCVEENSFSNQTTNQLIKLGSERNGLLVVV